MKIGCSGAWQSQVRHERRICGPTLNLRVQTQQRLDVMADEIGMRGETGDDCWRRLAIHRTSRTCRKTKSPDAASVEFPCDRNRIGKRCLGDEAFKVRGLDSDL